MSRGHNEGLKEMNERMSSMESRLARLEASKNYRDGDIISLIREQFVDEEDVMCQDLESMMRKSGVSKAGYKRAVTVLKSQRFFRMEKFGVNWAFHRCGSDGGGDDDV
jgi:hypothetical protein